MSEGRREIERWCASVQTGYSGAHSHLLRHTASLPHQRHSVWTWVPPGCHQPVSLVTILLSLPAYDPGGDEEAEWWLERCEDILGGYYISAADKVKMATRRLAGGAQLWADDVGGFTSWPAFATSFLQQFGTPVAALALKNCIERVSLLPAARRRAAEAERWRLTVAAVRHTAKWADDAGTRLLKKALYVSLGPLPDGGELWVCTASRPVGCAVAAVGRGVWLVCLGCGTSAWSFHRPSL